MILNGQEVQICLPGHYLSSELLNGKRGIVKNQYEDPCSGRNKIVVDIDGLHVDFNTGEIKPV